MIKLFNIKNSFCFKTEKQSLPHGLKMFSHSSRSLYSISSKTPINEVCDETKLSPSSGNSNSDKISKKWQMLSVQDSSIQNGNLTS